LVDNIRAAVAGAAGAAPGRVGRGAGACWAGVTDLWDEILGWP